jgi:ectoine hydroxylase-related dioxygenase (phytanoyl-CoA dioxygenase family)
MTYLSDEQERSTGMTQEQAERLAEWGDDYRARKIRCHWVVWCNASDHCVDFDQI